MKNNILTWDQLKCPSKKLECILKDLFSKYTTENQTLSVDLVGDGLVFTFDGVDQSIDISKYLDDVKVTDVQTDGTNLIITLSDGTTFTTDLTSTVQNLESLTVVGDPTLTGTVLSFTYTDEAGTVNTKTIDLASLAVDINTASVSFDSTTNQLLVTETDGTEHFVSLTDLIDVYDISIVGNSLNLLDGSGNIINTVTIPTTSVTNTVAGNRIATINNGVDAPVNINESIVQLGTPTLSGTNVLTIPFTNETGIVQTVTVDLSSLTPTIDVQIDTAAYDAATNIITLTETNGDVLSINLSEFSIVSTTNPDGSITVTQEGIIKFTIPAPSTSIPVSVTNTAAPYSFDSTTQALNIPQVPTIVSGQLVQGDGTAPEQIPDNWRVGRSATGALPDGTTDVTEDIGHRSDIFVGADAFMTVGHGSGDVVSNTALGNFALESNTTGNSNTASGTNSLRYNTTGSQNTASGVSSLLSNTTGNSNTASGVSSLRYNTTGNNNTTSGTNSLFSNTTGSFNTASGVSSLYSNTTGSQNTANGVSSLRSNTTGIYNTASGVDSLRSNTTGIYNTASGVDSLLSNTTGDNNTTSGTNSLFSNTTGDNNTTSGVSSLFYNQEIENTAIGAYSFNSFNLLLSGATITANTSTQITLSAPMTPSPAVGSYITLINIAGYNNSISGLILPKSYKVISSTILEVTDTSQVLGITGTATGFEIRQSLGYTNSSAVGYDAEPTDSNQVKLGDTRVTEINLGNNLILDVAAILGAADGTALVKRLVGGVHKITI